MDFLQGDCFEDNRGKLFFSNNLDLSLVKRMYIVENTYTDICRAWQAHKVEKRWFVASQGSFRIRLVKIDSFENPSDDLIAESIVLYSKSMDSLFVDSGFATSIQALEKDSKLIVFSDYHFGEVSDNYKYDSQKWK